jgi:hypothetical protein
MTPRNEYTFRRVATAGCEILRDGIVVAWTVDEEWAALIVARLNNDFCVAVGAGDELPDAACCCLGPTTAENRFVDEGKKHE